MPPPLDQPVFWGMVQTKGGEPEKDERKLILDWFCLPVNGMHRRDNLDVVPVEDPAQLRQLRRQSWERRKILSLTPKRLRHAQRWAVADVNQLVQLQHEVKDLEDLLGRARRKVHEVKDLEDLLGRARRKVEDLRYAVKTRVKRG